MGEKSSNSLQALLLWNFHKQCFRDFEIFPDFFFFLKKQNREMSSAFFSMFLPTLLVFFFPHSEKSLKNKKERETGS